MPQHKKHQSNAQRQAAYRRRVMEDRALQLAQKGLPPLPAISSIPGEKRWKAGLLQSYQLLEQILKEMQSYYQERSEQWQESERAELFDERQQMLEQIVENLQELTAG